jgi:hypothetical protein
MAPKGVAAAAALAALCALLAAAAAREVARADALRVAEQQRVDAIAAALQEDPHELVSQLEELVHRLDKEARDLPRRSDGSSMRLHSSPTTKARAIEFRGLISTYINTWVQSELEKLRVEKLRVLDVLAQGFDTLLSELHHIVERWEDKVYLKLEVFERSKPVLDKLDASVERKASELSQEAESVAQERRSLSTESRFRFAETPAQVQELESNARQVYLEQQGKAAPLHELFSDLEVLIADLQGKKEQLLAKRKAEEFYSKHVAGSAHQRFREFMQETDRARAEREAREHAEAVARARAEAAQRRREEREKFLASPEGASVLAARQQIEHMERAARGHAEEALKAELGSMKRMAQRELEQMAGELEHVEAKLAQQ